MRVKDSKYIQHYGILRKSGRYPWGSGEDQYSRNRDFLGYVDDLSKQGLSELDIARGVGVSVTDLRKTKQIAKDQNKRDDISTAVKLRNKGWSNVAIGKQMERNESSVRSLLADSERVKVNILETTSNMLRDQVDKKGAIDVGTGVENYLAISKDKLSTAVAILKDKGYKVHNVKIQQQGTGRFTNTKVLARDDVPWSKLVKDPSLIKTIDQYSTNGGRSYEGLKKPISVDSKRLKVRYAEEGGTDADGVIYLRPGVKDLSLGGSTYAQVRIAVDGSHYLKGMAMYRDDLPDGVDLVFNTNKKNTGNKLEALKEMKKDKDGNIDHDNPFGSAIKPGGQRGALNIVNEQGDWGEWSKNLSSQFLSKQSPKLAKTQLDVELERKLDEFDELKKLTNPSVKRKLLQSFSDDADSSAVHLKAAALPRQATHVILPINSLREDQIFAPNYDNGTRVALVRYPHGGLFEIPELTVNNRHPEGKKLIGNHAPDAVGINSKVAERLSGADFDGDTVLVIPNNHGKVKSKPPLQGLIGFDPQSAYPEYEGMPKMSPSTKQSEMGKVSNLITDMTIRGANDAELARAVRHSMVVIDAEKHNLDYKLSEKENGIKALKDKYQKVPGKSSLGASTIISRASSRLDVPERKQGYRIDPVTGNKTYIDTGNTKTVKTVNKRTGVVTEKQVLRTQQSTKLAETHDAHTLSSGKPIEKIYADYSNNLKDLANKARLEELGVKNIPYSPAARKIFAKEVESLNVKLNTALRNAPLERQAQILAGAQVKQKKEANPDMDDAELKKLRGIELTKARARVGASKELVKFEGREWEAAQAGAISPNKLKNILDNADLDEVKKLATPKVQVLMTSAKKARAQAMLESGRWTQAEIAKALGVSLTTLKASFSE